MEKYTMQDWSRDGDFSPAIGQLIADDVVKDMRDCVPPLTCSHDLIQVGEPCCSDSELLNESLYTTFKRTAQGWVYCGQCLPEKTEHRKGWLEVHRPKEWAELQEWSKEYHRKTMELCSAK